MKKCLQITPFRLRIILNAVIADVSGSKQQKELSKEQQQKVVFRKTKKKTKGNVCANYGLI